MGFCVHCGNKVLDDARFCVSCGAPISKEEHSPYPALSSYSERECAPDAPRGGLIDSIRPKLVSCVVFSSLSVAWAFVFFYVSLIMSTMYTIFGNDIMYAIGIFLPLGTLALTIVEMVNSIILLCTVKKRLRQKTLSTSGMTKVSIATLVLFATVGLYMLFALPFEAGIIYLLGSAFFIVPLVQFAAVNKMVGSN